MTIKIFTRFAPHGNIGEQLESKEMNLAEYLLWLQERSLDIAKFLLRDAQQEHVCVALQSEAGRDYLNWLNSFVGLAPTLQATPVVAAQVVVTQAVSQAPVITSPKEVPLTQEVVNNDTSKKQREHTLPNIHELRDRATQLGIDPSSFGKKKKELLALIEEVEQTGTIPENLVLSEEARQAYEASRVEAPASSEDHQEVPLKEQEVEPETIVLTKDHVVAEIPKEFPKDVDEVLKKVSPSPLASIGADDFDLNFFGSEQADDDFDLDETLNEEGFTEEITDDEDQEEDLGF